VLIAGRPVLGEQLEYGALVVAVPVEKLASGVGEFQESAAGVGL
jgi:hypothetical protein